MVFIKLLSKQYNSLSEFGSSDNSVNLAQQTSILSELGSFGNEVN
jgi:hypothetical protein